MSEGCHLAHSGHLQAPYQADASLLVGQPAAVERFLDGLAVDGLEVTQAAQRIAELAVAPVEIARIAPQHDRGELIKVQLAVAAGLLGPVVGESPARIGGGAVGMHGLGADQRFQAGR